MAATFPIHMHSKVKVNGIRHVDPTRDMKAVVDLIEIGFAQELDPRYRPEVSTSSVIEDLCRGLPGCVDIVAAENHHVGNPVPVHIGKGGLVEELSGPHRQERI